MVPPYTEVSAPPMTEQEKQILAFRTLFLDSKNKVGDSHAYFSYT